MNDYKVNVNPACPERDDTDNNRDPNGPRLAVIAALVFVAVLATTNITGAVLAAVLVPIVNALNQR